MMPPEVATNIFCQLPSFSDVFALSAVCRRMRDLWLENVTPIYNEVAPKGIPCERAARHFLVDQGGSALWSPMSARDVVRMTRNAGVVDNAILQFEREIVSRVRMGGLSAEEFYGAGVFEHPPTLTRTERTRFIRSYYSLWSLMSLERSAWESRLQAMTSQELYYLHEMTKLTQSIGREEIVPPPRFPNAPPDSVDPIDFRRSEKRIALERRVWQQIQCNSLRFFERDAQHPSIAVKYEGYLWFVVLWDHWQPSLEDMVCHKSVSLIKPSQADREKYLWNESWDK
ncbi:MAG: hypothetical protein Q9225_007075 [Loekoesia sp. 1 TL-2023]